MLELVYNHDEDIRQWVSNELESPVATDKPVRTIGFMWDGVFIGGIVYHDYTGHSISCSIATIDKRWCQKKSIKAIMRYPFEDLHCERFAAICAKKNKKMRKLFEQLGFKYEGCLRKAIAGKYDAMVYSILESENKWLN